MNRTEASVSLFIITFFSAIQYAFLAGVPDSVSDFAFLFITGLVGFLITFLLFFNELFRLDKKQVLQGLAMAAETLAFNLFLLLGSSGVGATVSSCVVSAYFMFIPLLSFLLFRQKPDRNTLVGIAIVLVGLFFMMDADAAGLMNIHIFYLLVADMFFALYIITAGHFTVRSNPAILVMGERLFSCLIALILWAVESTWTGGAMTLPAAPEFWGSVLFMGFFMRGLYSVVQLYAQRYLSPLTTSLIFSTEIIMTMAASPLLVLVFRAAPESITPLRILGAAVMVAGILTADGQVVSVLKGRLARDKA